jgi:hypothetical protein
MPIHSAMTAMGYLQACDRSSNALSIAEQVDI